MLARLYTFPTPTVAPVAGYALGGGRRSQQPSRPTGEIVDEWRMGS